MFRDLQKPTVEEMEVDDYKILECGNGGIK